MFKIMIIRHAEKPGEGGAGHGVSIDGEHIKHELTVRGWQRAGALVRYFDPVGGHPLGATLATPKSIFASAAIEAAPAAVPSIPSSRSRPRSACRSMPLMPTARRPRLPPPCSKPRRRC